MTILVMHYAPGVLAVLKRNQCTTQDHYGDTGCDRRTHTYFTVVNVSIVTDEECRWCLERSWIQRHREQVPA